MTNSSEYSPELSLSSSLSRLGSLSELLDEGLGGGGGFLRFLTFSKLVFFFSDFSTINSTFPFFLATTGSSGGLGNSTGTGLGGAGAGAGAAGGGEGAGAGATTGAGVGATGGAGGVAVTS